MPRLPQLRLPLSPAAMTAIRMRRLTLLAMVWTPIIVLAATISLPFQKLEPVVAYVAVVLLAAGQVLMSWYLQRRLRELGGALERAQRTSTVGLVTAGFAHEMKNALTVIVGFAELARTAAERAKPPDVATRRNVAELEKEVRRAISQLSSFLGYARGEPDPRRPRDVNALVNDALSLIRPMARAKELNVKADLGAPPDVVADAHALEQILLNLLLNALDFAKKTVTISTRAVDGLAELRVADDGPGVPPADRARIFTRFVTTRAGGTGLGLSTSSELARAHGGTLTLDASAPGATFVVRLPAAAKASA